MIKIAVIALVWICLAPSFARAERREFNVGAMAELTGPYASIGEECLRGYKIAEEAFGTGADMTAHVNYGDHRREARTGISEFWKLIRETKPIAIASNAAPVVLAINPLARDEGLALTATVVPPQFTRDNPYAIRTWPTAKAEGTAIAEELTRQGFRRLAMIVLQDDYTVFVAKEVGARFQELGNNVVFTEDVVGASADYSSVITRLKRSNPDVIFLSILGDQIATAIRRVREQGLSQQLVGSFSLGRNDILAAASPYAEGAIFLEINGQKPEFLKRLREKFGVTTATGMNYACYAALGSILQTARHNPSVIDKVTLREVLSKADRIPLLDGDLVMKNREAQLEMVVRVVRNSKFENLYKLQSR